MSVPFPDPDDPRSTAAAALTGAQKLAPVLRGTLPALLGQRRPDGLGVIADRMEGERLFDRFTLRALGTLAEEIDGAVERETAEQVDWVPMRCIDGDEEFEPVTVRRRTPRGDALAAIAAELRAVTGLVARTEALLVAERLIGRRR
ncbi:MAG: hypothetical protein MUC67_03520 [Acidobacteria bacterium]|jgi:hypothetical protein|nr:hypothetical protein [Acidobacteriota bacterium]MCU0854768.1 hypothetical protein [Paracoccaceae bacterium]